jgi:hypothetical protein
MVVEAQVAQEPVK